MKISNFKIQTNKYFLILISIFLSNLIYAQVKVKGDRDVRIQQTAVSDFKTLAVGNEFEVVLIKAFSPSVTVEADANLHSAIVTNVNDSILNITFNKELKRAKKFKVLVRYTENLKSIILRDNVNVEAQEAIQLTDLDLTLENDSKIKADINAEKFKLLNNNDSTFKIKTNCQLNIESKHATLELNKRSNNIIKINAEELVVNMRDDADLDIEGFTYDLALYAESKGTFDGKSLLTNNIKAQIQDKAQVTLQATDSIQISASGKSELTLYGKPNVIIINQLDDDVSIHKKTL